MIERLEQTQRAKQIFGNWSETIIWSCIQKVMGHVYTDNVQNPKSVMAVLGDFCFLAGHPEESMIFYRPAEQKKDFVIMVPQNAEWEKIIVQCYGEKAKKVTRYATKKEKHVFDKEHLKKAVYSLRPGYEMRTMNQTYFHLCRTKEWSRDLVSQFSDYAMYQKLGIGIVVLKDEKIVSGASSYARYRDGIEIEIDTKPEERRKGLAYACGAKLILECLERNLYPSWDAHNKASICLAEKLGYHCAYSYPAYEIWG